MTGSRGEPRDIDGRKITLVVGLVLGRCMSETEHEYFCKSKCLNKKLISLFNKRYFLIHSSQETLGGWGTLNLGDAPREP